jgi:putative transposase
VRLAAFIATQRAEHQVPATVSCHALGVSESWFYKWRDGDVSLRRAARVVLAAEVRRLFLTHHKRYGSPRIAAECARRADG